MGNRRAKHEKIIRRCKKPTTKCSFSIQFFFVFDFQFKLLEKEKRQLEAKLEMLDKLSRALQQERSELQTTIKNLKADQNQSANGHESVAAAAQSPNFDGKFRSFVFLLNLFD